MSPLNVRDHVGECECLVLRRRLSTGAAKDKITIFVMPIPVPHANLFRG
jgi:hypothetical protein